MLKLGRLGRECTCYMALQELVSTMIAAMANYLHYDVYMILNSKH